ncbi:Part of AAA domain-containing protein [Monaibacterium marinum]|uniref:Part of AAA domain-containing protein n=1 Tax=Pontivivens marinum TaxID=1690039 RepID=A0A2C9CTL9_9RHOB|nr:DUF3320 domain-containing protein [Monaibacterium marinum]SOH94851.1 Part of AAA domain-containing protein [Monaibacterium marinum]
MTLDVPAPLESEEDAPKLVQPRLTVDHAKRLTYASLQNAVPLLQNIVLYSGDEGLSAGTLRLGLHPTFAVEREWSFRAIAPNSSINPRDLETKLDGAFFDALNEAENGRLRITAEFEDGRAPLIYESPVELLARDEWGGVGEMGQLLAAFVQPNDLRVAAILRAASDAMKGQGLSSGLDGYQSGDPARAWAIAAAIWSAVEGMDLRYAVPPASFERRGQKVRTPARLAEEGLATCLDTALLIAAALEASGLNPVVVFTEGHAFTGVWLVKRTFGTTETWDVTDLRKAIVAREFLPFETTLLTGGNRGTFRTAVSEGQAQLAEAREHLFGVAVDIARCRSSGIRPLARTGRAVETHDAPASADPHAISDNLLPPEGFEPPDPIEETAPATPQGRIDRWQRKLLDLSLRNRLLNFRDTQGALMLACHDVPRLEDELTDGQAFKMISLPDENPRLGRDPDQYRRETGEDIDARVIRDALDRGELCSPLPNELMRKRLTALYRKARSDLAEGGTNTLFLAIGFLRWKQSETATKYHRAPLLLVPVTLRRASASSPFTLVHQGDEVRFNLTLLEKLAEQGIEAPDLKGELPRDEAGLDVPRIFRRMREVVRNVPGFEVVEDLALSTFSFAKYLMWKDLVERTDQLRENRLVAHLIDTPDDPFVPEGASGLPTPREVEAKLPPAETFTPLPADASQLAAVAGAVEGHDMVVIGPPGTGKSQTIANLIAHCLAHGKTILFVAEKAAALDVVHRRLTAYGLGDAVLEIHSSKAERKNVIGQLGRAWERPSDGKAKAEWARVSEELGLERNRLNDYVEALHHRHGNGLTVFEAIGLASRQAPIQLSWDRMDAHDAETRESLRRLTRELGEVAPRVRDPGALCLVEEPEGGWSNAWTRELTEAAAALEDLLRKAIDARTRMARAVGQMAGADPSMLEPLARAVLSEAEEDRAALSGRDPAEIQVQAETLREVLRELDTAEGRLSVPYAARDLARVPVAQIDADWRRAEASIWPLSVFRKGAVRRMLSAYAQGKANPAHDLTHIEEVQDGLATLHQHRLAGLPDWRGRDTDADALDAVARRVAATNVAARAASVEAAAGAGRAEAKALVEAFDAMAPARARFERLAGRTVDIDLVDLRDALPKLRHDTRRLQDWLHWRGLVAQAESRGLASLCKALEAGDVEDAEDAFDCAYAVWWTPLAIDAADPLRTFIGWKHQKRIEVFRELDARHADLAADSIRRRIAHGLPGTENVARNSALGRLRDLMGQQRPRESIRGLLDRLGPTTTKLTPCVLMSPLSVAQYLPAGQASFDIVLFDEASQITTWDAIGAIARARQSVIVGDPKQMPPSRGFDRVQEDDEELAFYERDQASILDEAVAAGVPQNVLRVHYRSRDEGLIAFSNQRYYDGGLVTFPAPRAWGEAVRLHRVEGVYDRGGSRTNPVEADKVADFVTDRLRAELAKPEENRETIGVVTFNIQQQQRILDHLDRARSQDDSLEWFFSDEREEPVIVKNLENIQGDERDVMVFSTTFGRDAAGKLSMNFGPMNQNGGQKRLNVAVTRARREMHVFTSIDANDIDVTRTKAEGVRDLRDFLDYAARGPDALAATDTGSLGGADSPFEVEVKTALEALGWEVRTQIGVSGYRIDLGIVHPDRAGRYLAGVECDGATYHSSPTARDRDRMRQAVLEGLGWRIERIWSTEWFLHRRDVLERIDADLRAQLKLDREQANDEMEQVDLEDVKDVPSEPAPLSPPTAPVPGNARDETPPDAVQEPTSKFDLVASQSPLTVDRRDEPAPSDGPEPNSEAFHDSSYDTTLRDMIRGIVNKQGPVHLNAVARQIADRHGWKRVGGRIRARVEAASAGLERMVEPCGVFLWTSTPEAMIRWRDIPGRDPAEISVAEIAGLLQAEPELLQAEDSVLALARRLGLSRLAERRRIELEVVLSAAQSRLDV